MKINYSEFNENDFAADENFQQWVLNPNEEIEAYWHDWLIENPDRKSYVEEAREMVSLMKYKPIYVPEAHINTIREAYQANTTKQNLQNRKWSYEKLIQILAALALIAVATYIFIDAYEQHYQYKTYHVQNGQKLQVVLADGSQVWLNAGSSLKHSKSIKDDAVREVILSGEAYFEIKMNKQKPFIIHAAGISVAKNEGTLNITSYPENKNITVIPVSGTATLQVKGTKGNSRVGVTAGKQAVYNKTSQQLEVQEFDNYNLLSWKDGKLILQNERLDLVATKLERWYDVEIHVKHGAPCPISLTIENESLEDILASLKGKFQLSYQITGDRVLLAMECD